MSELPPREVSSLYGWSCLPAISPNPERQQWLNDHVNFPARHTIPTILTEKQLRKAEGKLLRVVERIFQDTQAVIDIEKRNSLPPPTALPAVVYIPWGGVYIHQPVAQEESADIMPVKQPESQRGPDIEHITDRWQAKTAEAWQWMFERRVQEQRAQPPGELL